MFLERLRTAVRSLRRPKNSDPRALRDYCLHVLSSVPEPVFVKVGAHDGITGDPCSDILLANTNWRGLLIEPVPYCFDRLKENFEDSQRFCWEQVAIGAQAGHASFYYVDANARQTVPNLPIWFDQLGSFDRNHIVKHWKGRLEPFIRECQVQVCPLPDVLARHRIQDVHLLHIDAEGHDFEVLKTVDFAQHAPRSIFVEHRHLSSQKKTGMLQLLGKQGYSVLDCGADYFAVKR